MPHDVDSHGVPENAWSRFTSLLTHQPRSWSKAEASRNIPFMIITAPTRQPPRNWLKDEAS